MNLSGSVSRRGLFKGAAGTLGATAMVALAGCSVTGKSAKPTKAAANPVKITFSPWGQSNYWQKYVQPGLQKFLQANPNIQVSVVAPGGGGAMAAQIAAGTGADVFEDWVVPAYLNGTNTLVLNLEPYLKADGLSTSLWSPGQMRALATTTGVYFLPCYVHVDTVAINLSALDAMGLAYPSPDWDYTEALALWQKATTKLNGTQYYGINPDYNFTNIGTFANDTRAWALHIMGGDIMDDSRTVCTVDSPQVISAVDWWNTNVNWPGLYNGGGINQNVVFQYTGSNGILTNLTQWAQNFNWTYFPVPAFPSPVNQISFEALDFHAINVATKHPEQAWALLKYIAADPYYSNFVAKYTLRPPSLISAWDGFVSLVEQEAPFAANLGIKYFIDAAQTWGYAGRSFLYQDEQALNLINQALASAAAAKDTSSATELKAAAQAVNSLIQSAMASSTSSSGSSSTSGSSASSSSASGSSSSSGSKASSSSS